MAGEQQQRLDRAVDALARELVVTALRELGLRLRPDVIRRYRERCERIVQGAMALDPWRDEPTEPGYVLRPRSTRPPPTSAPAGHSRGGIARE